MQPSQFAGVQHRWWRVHDKVKALLGPQAARESLAVLSVIVDSENFHGVATPFLVVGEDDLYCRVPRGDCRNEPRLTAIDVYEVLDDLQAQSRAFAQDRIWFAVAYKWFEIL